MLNKIKENLSLLFILIVLVIIFLWGKSCGSSSKQEEYKPIIRTVIKHKTDTIRDTLKITEIKYKGPREYTIVEYIKDTAFYNNLSKRVYYDTARSKDVVIYSTDTVIGSLVGKKLSYKLLVPLKIIDTTIVEITKDSLIFVPNKYEIHAGLIASPKMLAPTIEFSIDRSTYGIGYDPFNKQPVISYKYRLFSWTPKKRK